MRSKKGRMYSEANGNVTHSRTTQLQSSKMPMYTILRLPNNSVKDMDTVGPASSVRLRWVSPFRDQKKLMIIQSDISPKWTPKVGPSSSIVDSL